MALEQEVKLVFESLEAARQAVVTAGARLLVSRRLLRDVLFDTPDGRLRREGCGLRIRRDGARAFFTFKGPVQPGPVKSRDEHELALDDADIAERIVRELGFQPWFRSEKYREEYALAEAHVSIDEAPIGVFIEIEANPAAIDTAARQLGRGPADYRLESYARLYSAWCTARGVEARDMLFANLELRP